MGQGHKRKWSEVRGQRSESSNAKREAQNTKLPLSVYMITFNNGTTIEKALQSVSGWADEVIVVDSHSTDGAQEVIQRYTGKLFQYDTKDLREKYQYAQDQCSSPWVLFIDADEWLVYDIKAEISD